jgi:hypothetical protein
LQAPQQKAPRFFGKRERGPQISLIVSGCVRENSSTTINNNNNSFSSFSSSCESIGSAEQSRRQSQVKNQEQQQQQQNSSSFTNKNKNKSSITTKTTTNDDSSSNSAGKSENKNSKSKSNQQKSNEKQQNQNTKSKSNSSSSFNGSVENNQKQNNKKESSSISSSSSSSNGRQQQITSSSAKNSVGSSSKTAHPRLQFKSSSVIRALGQKATEQDVGFYWSSHHLNPEAKPFCPQTSYVLHQDLERLRVPTKRQFNVICRQRRIFAKNYNNVLAAADRLYEPLLREKIEEVNASVSGRILSTSPVERAETSSSDRSTRNQNRSSNPADDGDDDLEEESWPALQRYLLSGRKQSSSATPANGLSNGALHHGTQNDQEGKHSSRLRQKSPNSMQPTEHGNNANSGNVHQVSSGSQVVRTGVSSSNNVSGSTTLDDHHGPQLGAGQSGSDNLLGLQNSKSMGGHGQSDQRELRPGGTWSGTKRTPGNVVKQAQDNSKPTIQGNCVHSGGGKDESSSSRQPQGGNRQAEEERNVVSQNDAQHVEMVEEKQGNSTLDLSLDQKNGSGLSGSTGGGPKTGLPNSAPHGKTPRQEHAVLPVVDDPLHLQQSQSGQDLRNTTRNGSPLAPAEELKVRALFDAFLNVSESKSKPHSFTRRSHNSKIPTREQNETVRYHSKDVSNLRLNLQRILSLMSDSHRKRFMYLYDLTFVKSLEFLKKNKKNNSSSPTVHRRSNASSVLPKQAAQLVEHSIAARVSPADLKNSLGTNKAFNVIEEEKVGDYRLRFILWTQELNEFLDKEGYKAEMSQLRHSSYFVDAISDECAALGDLKISFFQLLVPEEFRCALRFPDSAGDWYELLRLPMGLKPAAEIMQLICETLAGMPHACQPSAVIENKTVKLSSPQVSTAVWIDGFRASGKRQAVEATAARIRVVGDYCNATWKNGVTVETEYDFIGIHHKHRTHEGSVADKTLNKLPRGYSYKTAVKVTQLEQDVSRLFFCSGVLRIVPAHYYFAIKWINRHVSRLNRPDADLEATVCPPRVVCDLLNDWLTKSRSSIHLPPNKRPPGSRLSKKAFDILFTDASVYGWGAYFVSASGEIAIVGGKWDKKVIDPSPEKMAQLEAMAVDLALQHFKERLLVNKNVDIRIDNTSVKFGMQKGKSKTSPALNEALKPSLDFLVSNNFMYSLAYVNTKENWADRPSRGIATTKNITSTEVEYLYENRGTFGRQARNSFVSVKNEG